jgi:hypothetical protein
MNVARIMAVFGVLPLALGFLWFAVKLGMDSFNVRTRWLPVQARVVDTSQQETITLEFVRDGATVRQDVRRDAGFGTPALDRAMPLLVNPADSADLRQNSFADLWLTSAILGFFGLALAGIAAVMLHPDDGSEQMARLRSEFEVVRTAAAARPAATAESADDGGPITVREPGQSWKANVFWGLILGLPAVVLPLLPFADAPPWQRAGYVLLGLGWMGLMGFNAARNHGRTVTADEREIVVSTVFGSEHIPLSEITRVERTDVRQQLREFEAVGRSSSKTVPFSTMAPVILYILYDADGRTLLKLDKDMEPAGELHRLLRRLETISGRPIGSS